MTRLQDLPSYAHHAGAVGDALRDSTLSTGSYGRGDAL